MRFAEAPGRSLSGAGNTPASTLWDDGVVSRQERIPGCARQPEVTGEEHRHLSGITLRGIVGGTHLTSDLIERPIGSQVHRPIRESGGGEGPSGDLIGSQNFEFPGWLDPRGQSIFVEEQDAAIGINR